MSIPLRSLGNFRSAAIKALIPVNFICHAPQASRVSVVGDFNEWNADTHLLDRAIDGSWLGSVSLRHGHHRYAFCVDGTLQVDPRGQGLSQNDAGQKVSLLAVS